jgi:hypothetical protein
VFGRPDRPERVVEMLRCQSLIGEQ